MERIEGLWNELSGAVRRMGREMLVVEMRRVEMGNLVVGLRKWALSVYVGLLCFSGWEEVWERSDLAIKRWSLFLILHFHTFRNIDLESSRARRSSSEVHHSLRISLFPLTCLVMRCFVPIWGVKCCLYHVLVSNQDIEVGREIAMLSSRFPCLSPCRYLR